MKELKKAITCTPEQEPAACLAKLIAENRKSIKFPVYPGMLSKRDISELDLTQRSYNCLKRGGIETIGDIVDRIERTEDLMSYRNLGKKSAQEIMYKIYLFQYSLLPQQKKKTYLNEVLSLNTISL